nr:MAG TPA: hypothetical protein [Caudoviricetes sp.]
MRFYVYILSTNIYGKIIFSDTHTFSSKFLIVGLCSKKKNSYTCCTIY